MCITPTYFWRQAGPGWVKVPKSCGDCWSCKRNRVNDYVARSLCEASTSDWTLALTLTYAPRDDYADRILTPKHFQDFVRSVRRRGHKIRYLAVGEYGTLRGRAHFHSVIFGKGNPPPIPHQKNTHIASWPHGHVYGDWNADEKSLKYVCKYLLKDEPLSRWFSLSKQPPLGAAFFRQKAQREVEAGVLPSSFNYLPPGGSRDAPYLLTGASRRDYLLAVTRGWQEKRPLSTRRLSEWVLKVFEANLRYLHQKQWDAMSLDEKAEAIQQNIINATSYTFEQLTRIDLDKQLLAMTQTLPAEFVGDYALQLRPNEEK